ncbi:MAG TPA: type II and III secretion system protein family protein [Stellaceae bacterium]|nr:type II and III secretion system protein family protein [Stellaceae bacterium]
MNRIAARLVACLALGLGAVLLAPARPAAGAAKVVHPTGAALRLAPSKGAILRLDRPVANVFIADPDIADIQVKSPTVIYVVGKKIGETTLFAVDKDDAILVNSRVVVGADPDLLQHAIESARPGTPVAAAPLDNSVVLSGTVHSAAEAEDARRLAAVTLPKDGQVVPNMQIDKPNQVNLRVRVAEVSRNVFKALGLNWKAMFGGTSNFVGFATGTAPVLDATGAFATGAPVTSPSGAVTSTFNNLFARATNSRVSVNALIDALEQQGLVTVLAEPNLTAVSGRPASFLAGGEFPIPVPQASTGTVPTITVQYKQFGVSLKFVATILDHDRISLDVEPEVSQLTSVGSVQISGITIPALTTRRAQTTVELGSGQSFAIAGLLQNDVLQNVSKVPWLGDVPVLGGLFRSTQFERDESELVIIVTPYIVKPVAVAQLPLPTDGFVAPSDAARVLNGRMNAPSLPPAAVPGAAVPGAAPAQPLGFELD